MAYRGRSNAASSNQSARPTQYGAGSKASVPQQQSKTTETRREAPENLYKVKIKNPEGAEFKYSTIGMVSRFADSGNMVLSLRKDLIADLTANDSGWINGLQLFTVDAEEKK
jgi:hypothetical protein